MKMKGFALLFMIYGVVLAAIALASENGKTDQYILAAPKIQIMEPVYEFPTVFEGKEVLHDFVIKNTGSLPLQIQNVETTCGCTSAFFTRQIDPGGEGKVSIRFNSSGYGGQTISKTVTLINDDPLNRRPTLLLKGHVDYFAQIIPEMVRLMGRSGAELIASVEIIPSEKYPFHVIGVHFEGESHCAVKIEALPDRYRLRVENKMEQNGKYLDRIFVDTDHPEKKQLVIRVQGIIDDPVSPG